jgi:hypothetical protein
MTTSLFTTVDGLKTDDELHSPIIDGVKLEATPAYADSVKRLQSLGLTKEEAEALLKG